MHTFLMILIALLVLIVAGQLLKISSYSSELSGKDEGSSNNSSHKLNAGLLLSFLILMMGSVVWMVNKYGHLVLPEAASEHGVLYDSLFNFTFGLIFVVFVITQIFLFVFAYKYYFRPDRKAAYIPHNNKLEIWWTIIPSIVLFFVIIYGLSVWDKIMYPNSENPQVIELYARQYDWHARYAGDDGELGGYYFKNITSLNPLGLDTNDQKVFDDVIKYSRGDTLYLPLNKPVLFKFRSQDVIHSAYMPHFRAQMNCVPGMETQFVFTPTISTNEMREKTGDPNFNYMLLCNKICGAGHSNMGMVIKVVDEPGFNKWLDQQKVFDENKLAGVSEKKEKIAAHLAIVK